MEATQHITSRDERRSQAVEEHLQPGEHILASAYGELINSRRLLIVYFMCSLISGTIGVLLGGSTGSAIGIFLGAFLGITLFPLIVLGILSHPFYYMFLTDRRVILLLTQPHKKRFPAIWAIPLSYITEIKRIPKSGQPGSLQIVQEQKVVKQLKITQFERQSAQHLVEIFQKLTKPVPTEAEAQAFAAHKEEIRDARRKVVKLRLTLILVIILSCSLIGLLLSLSGV